KLPDGTVRKTRTEAERDKLLDGKFDKTGGTVTGDVTFNKNAIKSTKGTHTLPEKSGTLMQVGDYGVGGTAQSLGEDKNLANEFSRGDIFHTEGAFRYWYGVTFAWSATEKTNTKCQIITGISNRDLYYRHAVNATNEKLEFGPAHKLYSTNNTTKDSNGNLKAASPIVKLFADHIELNEESEGVEMEHLGVGHYLIKGVVGFNSDGAWGINNGFVIPQDHNGKNMVLIDYEVRPDGDIEVFVFHQQNADMPERFQNKRIKYIDKDGNPVYYENYEPCDVPESRWIDMRVEMPVNSIYNLKQAEAERLAKEEAERQAEEEQKSEINIKRE
ncbi:hypothetical protein AB7V82_19160, partial [Providencia stuartii]|uniref:phage tail fiber protein n=1 Tax=Providencia stuartii TaxID=588 RepID=UPI0034E37C1C